MIKKLFEKYPPLRYIISSLLSFLLDNALYFIFVHFVLGRIGLMTEVIVSTCSQVLARVLSSFFNFNCNNYFVFRNNEKYSAALLRYYCLCIPQTVISVILLDIVLVNISISSDILQTAFKIIIEAVLFAASYVIQNRWVFSKKK